jgi:hypothetical protein
MTVKADVGMNIKMNSKSFKDIILLEQGKPIDEAQIEVLIDFVNQRFDCADFRMIVLIKTYIAYKKLLSESLVEKIKDAMLGFKYWMDEPGSDGMCFWSENHQILFHTCEYLVGHLFPDETFRNDGNPGYYHIEKAHKKIVRWLDYKFRFGFIEWHSNTYYEEDIAPLVMLVDYANDHEIVEKSRMILDLLFLDMALHSFEGYFVATSGRCYETQKKDSNLHDVNDILAHAFGIIKKDYDYERLSSLFILSKNYQVPDVIKMIAQVKDPLMIKDSMGLDLNEVKRTLQNNDIDDLGMFLWQMEAFTNPESIDMTMKIFNAWKLHDNNFLKDLGSVNIPVLRKLKLLPLVVRILNPATQGVAIERANTYTYKTKDYMLSTAQKYHPKKFGDQHHIWQATLPNQVNIFSTHPGSPMFDDAARNFSPSYWVGNGINPLSVQDENTLFLMYDLTPRKGYLERERQHLIHFYFPMKKMDQVVQRDQVILGRVKDSYIAIISSKPYEVKEEEELIYFGKKLQFIVLVSSKDEMGSFENFNKHVKSLSYKFSSQKVSLQNNHHYLLRSSGRFFKDQKKMSLSYDRFDTPFVQSKRDPKKLTIYYHNDVLFLDFKNLKREEKCYARTVLLPKRSPSRKLH